MAGKWRLYAKRASSAQKTFVTRSVFCVTGSEKSPPGGDTAPMTESEPWRLAEPKHSTEPERS